MNQRKTSIDVLRGFALLGILLMNIASFAMPDAAYFNPHAYGADNRLNQLIYGLTHVLADQKFMALFSLLFGAGVILMTSKIEAQGKTPFVNHFMRNLWLLVFGIIHGVFIWVGDILLVYALLALPLYFLRKLSDKLLIVLGLIIYFIPTFYSVFEQRELPNYDAQSQYTLADYWQPSRASIERDLTIFRGNYSAQLAYRLGEGDYPDNQGQELIDTMLLLDSFSRALGMMLIGMVFFRAGILSAQRSRDFYRRMLVVGFAVGLPLSVIGLVLSIKSGWHWHYGILMGRVPNNIATPFIASAYLAAIMLWCQSSLWFDLKEKFAAVGRTAFTNYIAQSLIATYVFYGFGLGLYGTLNRWQLLLIILLIWIVQLYASQWWLKRFAFGPLEWLWRCLTYFKLQPLKNRH